MRKLGYFILGVLVAVAGASFAQSYTEFLNLRAIESIDLQGDLADSTGNLTINDSVDISGTLAVTGDITDASLSANVPLLNAGTNTFTGGIVLGTDLAVASGGTGASTLTGLLQGNGTSAFTAITNSTTVGQTLRVTGSNTYGWGALNLADSDAITGTLPDTNLSANVAPTSGTFTADFVTGCTTTPTVTFDYQRLGNIVVLYIAGQTGFPCTSDSVLLTTTATPVPSAIRPSQEQQTAVFGGFQNNATGAGELGGCMYIEVDGDIRFAFWDGATCRDGDWASSNSKAAALDRVVISYMLGNP